MTRLDLFDYKLPEDLIAQYPTSIRDESRLLVLDRATGLLQDKHFFDLPDYLQAGDVLVLNDSRVIHTRLLGTKQDTGANIELFLLKQVGDDKDIWEALARPARRLKMGDRVTFSGDDKTITAHVLSKNESGSVIVSLEHVGDLYDVLQHVGHVPLPPYIDRSDEQTDETRYQTVFANDPGSVAAPTAGLHFTTELLEQLDKKGVEVARVTLHVGLGTFRPVQTEHIEDHLMHEEIYYISDESAAIINAAKNDARRIICIGTTSVRTLESSADYAATNQMTSSVLPGWGSTNIFIYPGGKEFKVADALVTNFHLPKSTLLMLVSAFYDREKILQAYNHAIANKYRFFSYGDAMLII